MDKYYTESGSLNSTALDKYWYDRDTGDLFIKFVGGTVAGYKEVAMHVVRDFLASPSKGKFYSARIKDAFKGQTSDVELHLRNRVPAPESNPCVAVGEYEVTFTATMTSRTQAVSVEDAIQKLRDSAAKNGVSEVSIKSVTLNFD